MAKKAASIILFAGILFSLVPETAFAPEEPVYFVDEDLKAAAGNKSGQGSQACVVTQGQIATWAKIYGTSGDAVAWSIQETTDGGYIVGGKTIYSYPPGGGTVEDIYVLKIDAEGNKLWEKVRNYAYSAGYTYSVVQASDGGYIVGGFDTSYGYGMGSINMSKLDEKRNTIWDKSGYSVCVPYPPHPLECWSGNFSAVPSIKATNDGGCIVVATATLPGWMGGYYSGIYVLKLDQNGDEIWNKFYKEDWQSYYATSINKTADGGYIVSGHVYYGNAFAWGIYILRLDFQGNKLWSRSSYIGNPKVLSSSVSQTEDDGYIVTGTKEGDNFYVMKLNDQGNIIWEKEYGGSGNDQAFSIQQTFDRGYIVAGATTSFGEGGKDIYIIKLDDQGNEIWSKTYGGVNDDWAHSIKQTSDGGYIVAGATKSPSAADFDFWILKLDTNGNLIQNQPPDVSNPSQFWSDGETVIPVGRKTDESTVVFKANVSDPDGDNVKLQIELRRLDEYEGKFLNEPTQESSLIESGGEATITVYGLVYGNYHWQARSVDERNSNSGWVQFGDNDILDEDFVLVYMTLPEKAAELAICLARRVPKVDYGWGQKGYDFSNDAFFAPKGVSKLDCSGLVLWVYNRAYYPNGKVSWEEAVVTDQCEKTKGPVKCTSERDSPICWEGAAQQSQYNTIGIFSREELMVGDLIFMPKTPPDTSYDHIMIYVGDDKVVHAYGNEGAVVEQDLADVEDSYPNVPKKYRRVRRPELFISDDCPIDFIVTDPDGLVISKVTSDIPCSEYFEHEIGDGEAVNVIAIAFRKAGDYRIRVVPESGALPTDTYNLAITLGNETIILAENVQINNIPDEPYIVRSTQTEIIPIIPATIDFDPDTLNLRTEAQWVTVYIELPIGHGYDASDINVDRTFLEGLLEVQHSDIQDGVLMVKFDRQDVIFFLEVFVGIIPPDQMPLTVIGELKDETRFEGSDTIRIIDKGGKKN